MRWQHVFLDYEMKARSSKSKQLIRGVAMVIIDLRETDRATAGDWGNLLAAEAKHTLTHWRGEAGGRPFYVR